MPPSASHLFHRETYRVPVLFQRNERKVCLGRRTPEALRPASPKPLSPLGEVSGGAEGTVVAKLITGRNHPLGLPAPQLTAGSTDTRKGHNRCGNSVPDEVTSGRSCLQEPGTAAEERVSRMGKGPWPNPGAQERAGRRFLPWFLSPVLGTADTAKCSTPCPHQA